MSNSKFQAKLAAKRASKDKAISHYVPGDLVLWNPREKPSDHLPTKLSPYWLGPYEVISHVRNAVSVRHIVLHVEAVLHVERLKPFIGTRAQAISIARHDQHQYNILHFNYYTGNPFMRSSMTFSITFEDGTAVLPFGGDFKDSKPFESFIFRTPELFPLRYTASDAIRQVRNMEKLSITTVSPNDRAYMHLRIYDGRTSMWYDSLNLPDKAIPYVTPIIFTRWINRNNHREIEVIVPVFGKTHSKYKLILSSYDIMAYVFLDTPYWYNHVDGNTIHKYPQILSS
jgi:hypothetical protein